MFTLGTLFPGVLPTAAHSLASKGWAKCRVGFRAQSSTLPRHFAHPTGLDLNVLLDVLQRREPHYPYSAAVLNLALEHKIQACLPSHAITTVHYLVGKAVGKAKADAAIDWLLAHFEVSAADKQAFLHARNFAMNDFEDAVVVALALASGCDDGVTRNIGNFARSPIPELLPVDVLIVSQQ